MKSLLITLTLYAPGWERHDTPEFTRRGSTNYALSRLHNTTDRDA